MPVRVLAILGGLLALMLGVLALAWVTQAELYLCLPGLRFRFRINVPPTHPVVVLFVLAAPTVVALYSRHFGLMLFMLFPVGLLASSAIGYAAFQWTPSVFQHLLTLAAAATAVYGWSQREYFEY